MTIVVLGPGGVGGLLAGALERAGAPVDRRGTRAHGRGDRRARPARELGAAGRVRRPSARTWHAWGSRSRRWWWQPRPRACWRRSSGSAPRRALVLPLLNGLDHLALLRERFGRSGRGGHDSRRGRPAARRAWWCTRAPSCGSTWRARWASALPAMEALAATPRAGAGIPARVARRVRAAGDVGEAGAPQRAGVHDERVRQAARGDPRDARSCARSSWARSRRAARWRRQRGRASTRPTPWAN